MKKDNAGDSKTPGKLESAIEESNPQSSFNLPTIKPVTGKYLPSKKNRETLAVRDFIRARLAAGQSVSEDTIYSNFIERNRRSQCLKILRYMHQTYPDSTALQLVNGLWFLVPVTEAP